MALVIRKPSENRFLKGNIFAPAGAGKTVFLGGLQLDPRTTPCLGIDFEGGSESLAGLDIDIAVVRTWQDYNEAYEILADPNTPYRSTFIDSGSETHKFALLEILRLQGPTRKDPDLLEQRDYGTATVQMRRLLREFRDLPMHVLFACHAKEIEVPREGRVRVPDLAGQMAEEISGIVSVQAYLAQFMEDGELHRSLLLHGFEKFRIKARTPWGIQIPEEIIDPTVSDLLDVLGFGSEGADLEEIRSRGTSRDKEAVEEEVPLDDGKRLPGVDSRTEAVEKKVEESIAADEVPAETTAEEQVENGTTTDAITADDLPNFQRMNLPTLRDWASENGVELNGAKTRRQILDLLAEKFGVDRESRAA